jgi:hypothetical protein
MPFPQDISNVACLKIHPAIGFARVSKNDDYFVFGTNPATYKTNGLIMRQAVQFRLFAYGQNGEGLGELTPATLGKLGILAVWSADVANRKLRLTAMESDHNLPDAERRVFGAKASSNDAQQGRLVTALPGFAEGSEIPLGQITSTGLFIPPKAGVYREVVGAVVPNYPDFTPHIADTTSDGVIRVVLDGAAKAIPVLPAWIVVSPGDYSPDVNPEPVVSESLLVHLKSLLGSNGGAVGTPHNETARKLDELAIQPTSADWAPGFETSLGERSEVPDIKALFYNSQLDTLVGAGEMRVRPRATPNDRGAIPGQLTSGLCSPWQTDFTACIGYWSENLPLTAFLDEADQTPVRIYRKKYDNLSPSAPRLRNGDDFERHQDKIGIARMRNSKLVETEREKGDDIVDGTA